MIFDAFKFFDEHSKLSDIPTLDVYDFKESYTKLRTDYDMLEQESDMCNFNKNLLINFLDKYRPMFNITLSDTNKFYYVDYTKFNNKFFIQFPEKLQSFIKEKLEPYKRFEITSSVIYEYQSLNINWCIKNRLYPNRKDTFETLSNIFLTEGIILIQKNLFSTIRFTLACLDIIKDKISIDMDSNMDYKTDNVQTKCFHFNGVHLLIKSCYEKLINHVNELKRFECISDCCPYFYRLPKRKIWNPEMRNADYLKNILNFSKSRQSNMNYMIERFGITENEFHYMEQRFNFTFGNIREHKINDIVGYLSYYDISLLEQSNYFILDKLFFENEEVRKIYKNVINKITNVFWTDENSLPRIEFYLLGEYKDGKIIQTPEQKKLMKHLEKFKSRNKIKTNKGEVKRLKTIFKNAEKK